MVERLKLSADEMAHMLARALKQAHDEENTCSCWPGPCRLRAYEQWKRDRERQIARYKQDPYCAQIGESEGDA